jgi:hypothetical protein
MMREVLQATRSSTRIQVLSDGSAVIPYLRIRSWTMMVRVDDEQLHVLADVSPAKCSMLNSGPTH